MATLMQSFDAVVENGALRPLEPIRAQEGQEVRVTISPVARRKGESNRAFLDRLSAEQGITGPQDLKPWLEGAVRLDDEEYHAWMQAIRGQRGDSEAS